MEEEVGSGFFGCVEFFVDMENVIRQFLQMRVEMVERIFLPRRFYNLKGFVEKLMSRVVHFIRVGEKFRMIMRNFGIKMFHFYPQLGNFCHFQYAGKSICLYVKVFELDVLLMKYGFVSIDDHWCIVLN